MTAAVFVAHSHKRQSIKEREGHIEMNKSKDIQIFNNLLMRYCRYTAKHRMPHLQSKCASTEVNVIPDIVPAIYQPNRCGGDRQHRSIAWLIDKCKSMVSTVENAKPQRRAANLPKHIGQVRNWENLLTDSKSGKRKAVHA